MIEIDYLHQMLSPSAIWTTATISAIKIVKPIIPKTWVDLPAVISLYKYAANQQAIRDFHYGLIVSAWASRFLGKCQHWFDPSWSNQ